ncbi:MAG: hypothetical protein ACPLSN_09410 [Dictyoglomus turgidum]
MLVYDKVLTTDDIRCILDSQDKGTKVVFKVRDIAFGKYCIEFANRIKIPVYLEIGRKDLYLELFKYWLTQKHIHTKVEPFWSCLQSYVKQKVGSALYTDSCLSEQLTVEPVLKEELFDYINRLPEIQELLNFIKSLKNGG